MRVFLSEFVTGGGMPEAPRSNLLAEGRAMAQAVAADFAALPGVELWTTRDERLDAFQPSNCRVLTVTGRSREWDAFTRLIQETDATLLIAPETGGELLRRSRHVESLGGWLLSPPPDFIEIAASKPVTNQQLASCGVPVPRGVLLPLPLGEGMAISFPAILKPVDGCGSQSVRLIRSAAELPAIERAQSLWLEEFVPGQAASAAVLCGPAASVALPACAQTLSSNGAFEYVGGRLPLAREMDVRARRLAERAVAALGPAVGYVGVDLVLGKAADGSGDRVIEVNPRLTTSYVGLRAAARTNLAAAMLAVAAGKTPDLCFADEPIEFAADGTIY